MEEKESSDTSNPNGQNLLSGVINTESLLKETEKEIKSIIDAVLTDPSSPMPNWSEIDRDQQSMGASLKTKRKNKLPKQATDLLQDWFLQNLSNPYPR